MIAPPQLCTATPTGHGARVLRRVRVVHVNPHLGRRLCGADQPGGCPRHLLLLHLALAVGAQEVRQRVMAQAVHISRGTQKKWYGDDGITNNSSARGTGCECRCKKW